MDPKRRLQMRDLLENPWLQSGETAATPLMTPDVLVAGSTARSAETGVKTTLKAFHQAHKEGFRLQVTSTALLNKRVIDMCFFLDRLGSRQCKTSSKTSHEKTVRFAK